MAPDASSTLVAPSAASKRPAAEQLLPINSSSALPPQVHDDEAARGKSQQQLECPRCHDTNTKFCYYNNYSTAQPRHFCRACRRYWTHGGTLRDVPVGGATRHRSKRRRLSSHDPSSSPKPHATTTQDDAPPPPDDLISTSFPFLSDGSYYLPQLDGLGLFAPAAAFTWPPSMVTDFYGDLAPPWDDGTVGGVTAGAWSDIVAGLDLSWPPPPSY